MKFLQLTITLLFSSVMVLNAQQYKRNLNWALGYDPAIKFDFKSRVLKIDSVKNNNLGNPPYCILESSSSISDTNGKLLFLTNGYLVYNSDGFGLQNGIFINCPKGTLYGDILGTGKNDQTSIILPKKTINIIFFQQE